MNSPMKRGFLRWSGKALQTVGPETEKEREASLQTISLTEVQLVYDDRKRCSVRVGLAGMRRVGIAGGWGSTPQVHVYRRSFLSENRL